MDIRRLSEADRISSLLLKRMAGTLTPEEQAEVDGWTAQSQQRQTYADLLDDTDYLQEEYHRQKGIDARGAMRRMQQRIDNETTRDSRRPYDRYAVAAVIAILIVGGLFWYWQYAKVVPPTISTEIQQAMAQSQQSGRDAAEVTTGTMEVWSKETGVRSKETGDGSQETVRQLLAAKRITTRSDREFWLTLPDGSLVHLNYNTHVIYPERFSGPTRDVILDGEAYFMVAKDRRHPFIVHTPQGDVKEYGTEFNVNTRSGGGEFTEVVLVEGSISVTPTNGTERMMQRGQMAQLSTADCRLATADVDPYVAWNTGKFVFEDCPLGKLMDVLGRWYDLKVEFRDEAARDILFTGILSRYADITSSLKAIATVAEVDIDTNGGQIIINPQITKQ